MMRIILRRSVSIYPYSPKNTSVTETDRHTHRQKAEQKQTEKK